jgi:RND family efflux transporter MFP subunit
MKNVTRFNRTKLLARIVVPAVLLGSTAAILAWTGSRFFERIPDAAVTPVALVASDNLAAQRVSDGLQAPGWIEPMPYATDVSSLREGVIAEVHALEGDHVELGAPLCTLERKGEEIALAKAEAELRIANAEIVSREASAAIAAREYELANDAERAQIVADVDVLEATIMISKAESEIAESESLEAESRDEFDRKRRLLDSGGSSEGEVRRLSLRTDALAAKCAALRHEKLGREARLDGAKAIAHAARIARTELLQERRARSETAAAVDSAIAMRDAKSAARDEARLALDRSVVLAPIAGTVLSRAVRPGSRINGDFGAMFTLFSPDALQVRCDIPLKDAAKIALGLEAEIRVDALPDRVFKGKLIRIVPQGDVQKNTVQCKVSIDSPDDVLRPDMLARVRIDGAPVQGGSRTNEAIAIPAEALRSRSSLAGEVLLAIPDGGAARTELRAVVIGDGRANGWSEISAGLSAGDRVVLDSSIKAGSRIRPIETPKGEAP